MTEIAVSDASDRQFGEDEILRAAELLTHAKVDVIAWNGTSASWLGFEHDERLCERITAATGIAACTSVLAFREIFERTGVSRVGLVTPYVDAVQTKIVENWRRPDSPAPPSATRLQDNFAFAEVSERDIAEMARAVASAGVDAVAIVCTNMRAAPPVERLEAELGVPVYNFIATTLWKSLVLTNVPPASHPRLGQSVLRSAARFGAGRMARIEASIGRPPEPAPNRQRKAFRQPANEPTARRISAPNVSVVP